jgi:MFS family permease
MPKQRARFLFLNLGHAYAHMFLLLYPTVVILLERQGAGGYGELLLPTTAGFVAFGLGTLPSGWLGDRWSRHGMLAAMFLGLGAAGLVVGLSDSLAGLTLGLALIGLAASIYHPVGIAMVVENAERVGRALGINGVWGNMGVAAAPLVAAYLGETFGWRAAFLVPAAVSLVTGFCFLLFVPGQVAVKAERGRSTAAMRLDRAAMIRLVIALALATSLGGLVFHALTVALPKILELRFSGDLLDVSEVGGLASAIFAAAAFAQIAVGHAIDRFAFRRVWLVVVGMQVPAFLLLGLLDGWAGLVIALLVTAFVFGEIPLADALVSRVATPDWRSRIYSMKYVLSLGVSAVAVPLVTWFHGEAGFGLLYTLLAGFALVVALAAALFPATRHAQTAEEALKAGS